jgi:hypothetical protein
MVPLEEEMNCKQTFVLAVAFGLLCGCGGSKNYLHEHIPARQELSSVALGLGETLVAIRWTSSLVPLPGGYLPGLIADDPSIVRIAYEYRGRSLQVSLTGLKPGQTRIYYVNKLSFNNPVKSFSEYGRGSEHGFAFFNLDVGGSELLSLFDGAAPADLRIQQVLSPDGKITFEIVDIPSAHLLIDRNCFDRKLDCDAGRALQNASSYRTAFQRQDRSGGKSPSYAACSSIAGTAYIWVVDPDKSEWDLCLFKDGSKVGAGSLYRRMVGVR